MTNYNKIIQKYDMFTIDWLIGTPCNYDCSYCATYLHDGGHKFVDIDVAKRFLNKVIEKQGHKQLI